MGLIETLICILIGWLLGNLFVKFVEILVKGLRGESDE